MDWIAKQNLTRCQLNNAPACHDSDAVGNVIHHSEVMGNKDIRQSEFLSQVPEKVQDLGLDRNIKC